MADVKRLASNIRFYRKQKMITQRDLAQELNISPQSVSKWERGSAVPDVENLCRISELLDVSVDALLDSGELQQRLLIGVDGGGSKTEFVLFTDKGYVLNRVLRAGCNPNTIGLEEAIAILKSGIDELLLSGKSAVGIFIGTAGLSTGNYGETIRKALKRVYPNTKIACNTDILNVIGSATQQESCIAAICGTGSVVYVSKPGKLTRIGGWGYLLDKGGSGYDIGKDALTTALAQRDGIGPESLITELIEEKLGCSPWDGIHKIYQGGTSYIASFAPVVFEAYGMGDPEAKAILERNASRLADLINCAYERNTCEHTVIIAGSVIEKNNVYLQMLRSRLHPKLQVLVPERPQSFGACVQCCRLCGISVDGLFEHYT